MIRETDTCTFGANTVTETLAQPGYRGCVYHFLDNLGPAMQAFPDFLREHKYQDVTESTNTAFQRGFQTDQSAFALLSTQPQNFAALQQAMTVYGPGTDWFSVFPFADEMEDFDGATVLVDVGGGFGHQCQTLLAAFPHLSGKLVVQDLPETLALGMAPDGMRAVAHNFFEPQPEKGARFYYMRHVLHDWPDEKCVAILGRLVDAMGPCSSILIDEAVLPVTGVPLPAAVLDLTMMSFLGARERTIDEWHALMDAAGLRILRVDLYGDAQCESIIQCVAK